MFRLPARPRRISQAVALLMVREQSTGAGPIRAYLESERIHIKHRVGALKKFAWVYRFVTAPVAIGFTILMNNNGVEEKKLSDRLSQMEKEKRHKEIQLLKQLKANAREKKFLQEREEQLRKKKAKLLKELKQLEEQEKVLAEGEPKPTKELLQQKQQLQKAMDAVEGKQQELATERLRLEQEEKMLAEDRMRPQEQMAE